MADTDLVLSDLIGNTPSAAEDICSPWWIGKCAELRERMLSAPPDDFLTWPTIQATMFVGEAPYTIRELSWLKMQDWPRWEHAIAESWVGQPPHLSYYHKSSGNLVHQAYHLSQWETHAGIPVGELSRIVEFGGGYGAMAYVARRAGFRGDYTIVDLPEYSLLQRWCLNRTKIKGVTHCATLEEAQGGHPDADLFIACWSLSETPLPYATKVMQALRARRVLFAGVATQGAHSLIDGCENWDWTRHRIPHIAGGEHAYWWGDPKGDMHP